MLQLSWGDDAAEPDGGAASDAASDAASGVGIGDDAGSVDGEGSEPAAGTPVPQVRWGLSLSGWLSGIGRGTWGSEHVLGFLLIPCPLAVVTASGRQHERFGAPVHIALDCDSVVQVAALARQLWAQGQRTADLLQQTSADDGAGLSSSLIQHLAGAIAADIPAHGMVRAFLNREAQQQADDHCFFVGSTQ